MEKVEFGADMRGQFCLSPDCYFTNHGSLGTVPKCVLREKQRFIEEVEKSPDVFFQWQKDDLYEEAVNITARFVGAQPENLVIVGNTCTGVSAVLRSLNLKEGEGILINSLSYLPVRMACEVVCDRVQGAKCQILDVPFPIESEDSFVEMYETYIKGHPEVKLAIIDHITSDTALLLPVRRLIEVCRRHGVLVMIDGAHAPGQVPLNLEEMGADFYTGSLHKWCYVPRGCSLLWVHPRHKSWVFPLVASPMYKKSFLLDFSNQGSMDYSSYLSLKAGLKFYQDIGGYDKITQYTKGLSEEAAAMLAQAWGTYLLPVPGSMVPPNMKTIRLPPVPYEAVEETCPRMMKDLYDSHKLLMCVSLIQGALYARICVQIYSTMTDFRVLRDAVLEISKGSKQ